MAVEQALTSYPAGIFPFGVFASVKRAGLSSLRVNDYDDIAGVFDETMGDDFHAATHDIRHEVVRAIGKTGALNCLDLCCGSGIFLSRLATEFEVLGWGFDLSTQQIAIARSRQPASPVTYRAADVRDVELPAGIDLATINFDALNHLLSTGDWRSLLRRVHGALRDGGRLLFDINLPKRLSEDWNSPEVIVKENLVYVQLSEKPSFEAENVRRRTPVVIFKRHPSGLFSQHEAHIEQLALPLTAVTSMLRDIGFSAVDVKAEEGWQPRGHIFNKHRAFLAARK